MPTTCIALLRAISVGGTSKLPMSDLVKLCKKAGFHNPRTFIARGNALFHSHLPEPKVKATLEKLLAAYFGKLAAPRAHSSPRSPAPLLENHSPKSAFHFASLPAAPACAQPQFLRLDTEVLRILFLSFILLFHADSHSQQIINIPPAPTDRTG